jgi:hypothetical protein
MHLFYFARNDAFPPAFKWNHRRSSRAICVAVLTWHSCASTPKVMDHGEVKIDLEDQSELKRVDTDFSEGSVKFSIDKKSVVQVPWARCTPKKGSSRGLIFLVPGLDGDFTTKEFCQSWQAQAFLQRSYEVITEVVTHDGPRSEKVDQDLGGPLTVQVIDEIVTSLKLNIRGIWGYDIGVVAGSFFAKKNPPGLNWLLLGGGIYDLEATLRVTQSDTLKSIAQKLKAQEGEIYLETRSIAWDITGLPKTIGLYHAQDDQLAPKSQSDSFNDQLRTAEFRVFKRDIAAGGHAIPWRAHVKIIQELLDQIDPEKKP